MNVRSSTSCYLRVIFLRIRGKRPTNERFPSIIFSLFCGVTVPLRNRYFIPPVAVSSLVVEVGQRHLYSFEIKCLKEVLSVKYEDLFQ